MASPKIYGMLAKLETTQFTDPTATGAANAILVTNPRITPLNIASQSRDLYRSYLGNSEQIPVQVDSIVEFDVEIAGSGAAGTAPAWGPLMRACGFAETLVASTTAAYNPVSAGFESIYLTCFRGNILKFQVSGAMGTVSLAFDAKQIPHFHFRFLGKYVAATDAAVPGTMTTTAFQQPRAAIPANTGTLTIGGYAAKLAAFSLDMANDVAHAIWINNETVGITDRKPSGSLTAELVPIATHDYFADILAATLQAFTYTHGTVAGNKVKIDAPKLQLTNFGETTFENTLAFTAGLTFNPNTGNDEVIITAL